jgi:hypothetical protein
VYDSTAHWALRSRGPFVAIALAGSGLARADEIKVMASVALKLTLDDLATKFESLRSYRSNGSSARPEASVGAMVGKAALIGHHHAVEAKPVNRDPFAASSAGT